MDPASRASAAAYVTPGLRSKVVNPRERSKSPVAGHVTSRSGGSHLEEGDSSISAPTNTSRVLHVEFDTRTGTFTGLPSVWVSAFPEGERERDEASLQLSCS